MNIKDFYYFYDLLELDISKIYVDEENHLNIVLNMPIHMDYIANGLRSDFDYTKTHTFSFSEYSISKLEFKDYIVTKYELKNDKIILIIDNQEITISKIIPSSCHKDQTK